MQRPREITRGLGVPALVVVSGLTSLGARAGL
jgi:hypothetical protein